MKITKKHIGIHLHSKLIECGWTRTELAQRAGVTREQVQWVFEGRKSYTIDTLLRIVNALYVSQHTRLIG